MTAHQQDTETAKRPGGPFPAPRTRERPWEATETDRGPFERRRGPDRREMAEPSAEASPEPVSEQRGDRRRRWGRRKSDVLSGAARETLTGRARHLARRFREPLIGLTLAGIAAPLVNAGASAPKAEKATKAQPAEAADRLPAEGDLDTAVGDYWAEAEEKIVRDQTIEGAVTRYGIELDLAQQIYDAATRHEIEPDMAYGLVFTESTFRERAVSHVGARGLTQLMPRTAQWLDPSVSTRDLFRRDVNLDLGFKYLRQLIDKYDNNVEHALTAYNRGPGTVDKILKRGGNPDNGYAGKVLAG